MINSEYRSMEAQSSNFMYRVYAWMTFALSMTAITAYFLSLRPEFVYKLAQPFVFICLVVAQLAAVLILSFMLQRLSTTMAVILFTVYAILVGITLSPIFLVYTTGSIWLTFAVTAGTFGAMGLYGYFTRADLSTMGSFLTMALIGLIIGFLVNMFLHSQAFDYVLSGIGVIIFTLLTASDVQKLKRLSQSMVADQETMGKIAVLGALTLYLDFINLFLFLLRFLGNRRD
jgi:FtsH-binding integral membrane protein